MINDYFRSEYSSYLTDEVKKNKYLMKDREKKNQIPLDETKAFKMPEIPPDKKFKEEEINKIIKQDFFGEDESFVNYWMNRKIGSNDDANDAHCRIEDIVCEDN
jgi:hypothetical protein